MRLRTLLAPLAGFALANVALADTQTFWKTDVCPDFGGSNTATGAEVGHMEATLEPNSSVCGSGGPICVLESSTKVTVEAPTGAFDLNTVSVVHRASEPLDSGSAGDPWACVVCQYSSVPEASVSDGLSAGSLLLAALTRWHRRQHHRD